MWHLFVWCLLHWHHFQHVPVLPGTTAHCGVVGTLVKC